MKTPSDQTAQDEGVGLDLTAAQISELPLYSRAEFDFAASASDELSFSVMCLSLSRNFVLLPMLMMCVLLCLRVSCYNVLMRVLVLVCTRAYLPACLPVFMRVCIRAQVRLVTKFVGVYRL